MNGVMDRYQVRVAVLKISVFILIGSTWVFSSFIFATRPEEVEGGAFSDLVRLPANIPGHIPGISNIPGFQNSLPQTFAAPLNSADSVEMDVMKLPCWDVKDEIEQFTSARWIRLTGRACQSENGALSLTVRNLTNGYMATVFDVADKSLTTDFIPLRSGRNDILIRINIEPGVSVESQFGFTRE